MLSQVSLPIARALLRLWIFAVLARFVWLHTERGLMPSTTAMFFSALWGLSAALYRLRAKRLLCLAISIYTLAALGAKCLLRIAFVIRHGGMDCHDCQGSPLLFQWHWMLESLLLFPGLAVLGLLLHVSVRER